MKKKLGRPFLPSGKAKSVLVAVRFSADESARIDKAVKRSKQEKPQWVRDTLLSATKNHWFHWGFLLLIIYR